MIAAAGSVDHDALVEMAARERARRAGAAGAAARAAQPSAAPARGPPDFSARVRFLQKDTEQYHVCVGGAGHRPRRRAPLRPAGARRRARRHVLLAALPGGPRAPRPGLLGLLLLQPVRPHRRGRPLCRHAPGEPRARRSRWSRGELERCVEDPASEEELMRSRENLKGRVVLGAGVDRRAHEPARRVACCNDMPILSVDEVIERIDAVDDRASARAGAASCSRRSGCRSAGVGPDEETLPGGDRAARRRAATQAAPGGARVIRGRRRRRGRADGRRPSARRSRARRTWSSSGAPTRRWNVAGGGRSRRRRGGRRLHQPGHGAARTRWRACAPACTS